MTFPLSDPVAIVALLLGIVGLVLFVGELPYVRGLFKYVPAMFWIYFIPMLVATAGLFPPESDPTGKIPPTPTYGLVGKYCLPACLVLLLLSVDIKAMLKLGGRALGVMLAGSLGILLGGPIVLLLFKPFAPEAIRNDLWSGLGSLSASWIGGSANMLTVRQMISTPPEVYSVMVVLDTILPYTWMCLLIILSRYQRQLDRFSGADTTIVDVLKSRSQSAAQITPRPLTLKHAGGIVALAAVLMFAAVWGGTQLPEIKNVVNAKAWSLVIATALGIALSFTPVRGLESYGASKIGYVLLYFVLASIGATTSLRHLAAAPILLLAGATWIAIHAVFILGAGKLLKAPMSLMATASQANIGGPASAPVLAEVYLLGLAPVGLLLAVMGNILGTPMGWVCSRLCLFVNGW